IRDQQTHALPEDPADRARLALALGAPDWRTLAAGIERRRATVARHFAAVAFRGAAPAADSALRDTFSALWAGRAPAADWQAALARAGFAQAPEIAELVARFASTAAVRQMGQAGARRLARFVPGLLEALRERPQPAVLLGRVLAVIENVLKRSAYVALLNENPAVRERLLNLCGESAWLTDEIARYPLLLDELLDPREGVPQREELALELER